MFHYDRGLFLTALGLAIDVTRRQRWGFVSHAHNDHMARHELALCTPATAALYRHRLGDRPVRTLAYGEPWRHEEWTLTTLPAGHMLGAAMLHVEHEGRGLLYTGDFSLARSRTADEVGALPAVETLVMESTFGDPRYSLPPREQVELELVDLARSVLDSGATPVVYAYAAGKAQEVTRLLVDSGLRVLQHPLIAAVSKVYARCGRPVGESGEYLGRDAEGAVVVMPPRAHKQRHVPLPVRRRTIAVTGWAADARTRHRLGVDHALPLSDHADFGQLLECVRRVAPRRVYCTHGPASFVETLRQQGWDARTLGNGE